MAADSAPPPDSIEQRLFEEAFEDGRFGVAFEAMTLGLGKQLHAMLRGEGLSIEWNAPPSGARELYGGMSAALHKIIGEQGEEASYKLIIARDLAYGLAELEQLMVERLEPENTTDQFARLLIQMVRIGVWMDQLGLATSGLMDEYGDLKWRAEQLKASQRDAAKDTNAKRQAIKLNARSMAQGMVVERPGISKDDLAIALSPHLKGSKVGLPKLIRWVGQWITEGSLPALPE